MCVIICAYTLHLLAQLGRVLDKKQKIIKFTSNVKSKKVFRSRETHFLAGARANTRAK